MRVPGLSGNAAGTRDFVAFLLACVLLFPFIVVGDKRMIEITTSICNQENLLVPQWECDCVIPKWMGIFKYDNANWNSYARLSPYGKMFAVILITRGKLR